MLAYNMLMQRKNTESNFLQKNTNRNNIHLSERECEVLAQLSQGVSNQVLANSLGGTINTVEKHLTKIYKKLGVTSRAEAILWWLRNGGVFRN